jgi:hypothetical protein
MLNIQPEQYHLKNERFSYFNKCHRKYSISSYLSFGIGSTVVRGLV